MSKFLCSSWCQKDLTPRAAGKFTDYGLSVKALSAALGRNDAELLAKALVDAERAGVGREPWERNGDRRVSDVKPGLGALSDGDCAILFADFNCHSLELFRNFDVILSTSPASGTT